MSKINYQLLFLLILFFPAGLISQSLKWEDRMNGNNSLAGLAARGWIVLDEDGGGVSDTWFQGRSTVFNSKEGPDTGYVAANYNGANFDNVVDHWLISPALNVNQGDSLSFFARSPDSSDFDDSIYVMLSTSAGTSPAEFISLGRFMVSKTGWQGFYLLFNLTGTVRFAIRYYLFDAQTNGDYIGLDLFQLYTKTINYPSTIAINKTFSFNDVTQSSSYRMIGLPGLTNFAIPVSGTRKTDWNIYYDNGAATNYLVEFDGTANFNFNPGKGFWVLSKNSINVIVNVNSVALAGDNTFTINLQNGWNIISNPFERSTLWSAVQNTNGLAGNAVIYDWAGNWTNPASFAPYKAYYFNNVTGLTSLKIPYDPSGSLGKSSENDFVQILNEGDISFSLLLDNNEKSKIIFGFNPKSSIDFDLYDYFSPPGDFDDARIVVKNEKMSCEYKYLMKDSRDEIREGQIYNIEFKNHTGRNVKLRLRGLLNYNELLAYLIDERINSGVYLTDEEEISVSGTIRQNNYRLLIGNKKFIEKNSSNIHPISFYLSQNYPNPFNPTTFVRYSIPKPSHVVIKIFDILGNEIKTIIDEEKSSGNYETEIDFSNDQSLASGVYFIKLKTESFSDTKKMILIR